MSRKYDAFVENPAVFLQNESTEICLTVRELTPDNRREKYASRYVRARISARPRENGDIIYLRYERGYLHPNEFGIEIVEDLGPYEVVETPART